MSRSLLACGVVAGVLAVPGSAAAFHPFKHHRVAAVPVVPVGGFATAGSGFVASSGFVATSAFVAPPVAFGFAAPAGFAAPTFGFAAAPASYGFVAPAGAPVPGGAARGLLEGIGGGGEQALGLGAGVGSAVLLRIIEKVFDRAFDGRGGVGGEEVAERLRRIEADVKAIRAKTDLLDAIKAKTDLIPQPGARPMAPGSSSAAGPAGAYAVIDGNVGELRRLAAAAAARAQARGPAPRSGTAVAAQPATR